MECCRDSHQDTFHLFTIIFIPIYCLGTNFNCHRCLYFSKRLEPIKCPRSYKPKADQGGYTFDIRVALSRLDSKEVLSGDYNYLPWSHRLWEDGRCVKDL